MTSPIAAVRSLPRFAYLSPAEAREVVLAVLGAVREPSEGMREAGGSEVETEYGTWLGAEPAAHRAFRAMIDALVAEVQEEGR